MHAKHVRLLFNVLKDDRSKVFYIIPEKYKSFHLNLIIYGFYELFDKHISTHLLLPCVDFIKKYDLKCEQLDDVFIPNFAFLAFCLIDIYSRVVELYELGDFSPFLLQSGFEICYKNNELLAKYLLNNLLISLRQKFLFCCWFGSK